MDETQYQVLRAKLAGIRTLLNEIFESLPPEYKYQELSKQVLDVLTEACRLSMNLAKEASDD